MEEIKVMGSNIAALLEAEKMHSRDVGLDRTKWSRCAGLEWAQAYYSLDKPAVKPYEIHSKEAFDLFNYVEEELEVGKDFEMAGHASLAYAGNLDFNKIKVLEIIMRIPAGALKWQILPGHQIWTPIPIIIYGISTEMWGIGKVLQQCDETWRNTLITYIHRAFGRKVTLEGLIGYNSDLSEMVIPLTFPTEEEVWDFLGSKPIPIIARTGDFFLYLCEDKIMKESAMANAAQKYGVKAKGEVPMGVFIENLKALPKGFRGWK